MIERFIGSRVLEVGAALGEASRFLSERAALTVLDSDPRCVDHHRRRFAQRENFRVVEGDVAERLPADFGERFDTVLCINVMEHIEDDRAALTNMYRALEPSGHLVPLVPANPGVYGTLDRLVGHYRRYSRNSIAAETRAAGIQVGIRPPATASQPSAGT